jgi:hypothetical protein
MNIKREKFEEISGARGTWILVKNLGKELETDPEKAMIAGIDAMVKNLTSPKAIKILNKIKIAALREETRQARQTNGKPSRVWVSNTIVNKISANNLAQLVDVDELQLQAVTEVVLWNIVEQLFEHGHIIEAVKTGWDIAKFSHGEIVIMDANDGRSIGVAIALLDEDSPLELTR